VAIKVKLPHLRGQKASARQSSGLIGVALVAALVLVFAVVGLFAFFYVRYEKIIDRRMNGPIFSNTARIYARPETVRLGQTVTVREITAELRRAGYTEHGREGESRFGTYRLVADGIEINPGPDSYHRQETARIQVAEGQVVHISASGVSDDVSAYELEPRLVTALFSSQQRAKRQVVHFNEIPKVMVDAVLAIEDRRFFQHSGVNYFRVAQAAWVDLRSGGKSQGGSTITMQMARAFFLSPQKTLKRKLLEMLIAIELEQKFSKQQIFELYANQVDMGQRGSFTIMGFAEASRAYFNKDLESLTLPEAALLAGIIQAPSRLSPYRHPERALDRRNLVLDSMVETGAITRAQAEQAKATPLQKSLAPPNVEASDAPYFVDLVKDQLISQYSESDLNDQAYRVYTTLDPDLQRCAAEAVQEGIKNVDEQVQKLRTRRHKLGSGKNAVTETTVLPGPMPQAAMVVLDAHTGEVLALVGGRNYGFSQLNHVVQHRPTGSIFKPFVYAAAINTALDGDPEKAETPVSTIDDSPTQFANGDQVYEPRNYKDEYHGPVPARYALAMSLNNATVNLAQQVGYDKVATLARAAGISSVKATPAMALGAYDATPMEMSGAYTVFANQGVHLAPILLRSVRTAAGDVLQTYETEAKPVLDPRVAYVMTSMMEGVLNYGTGYDVRRRGFQAPAAGKTGTSHDAWFAGYTSNLICIVWVGYDDYSDLRLSGAQTAAPIWAEFMKKAVTLPGYRDVQPFQAPAGVVNVQIDKITNRLATPACPQSISLAFIEGTEPRQTCEESPDNRNFFQKLLGIGPSSTPLPPSNAQPAPASNRPPSANRGYGQPQPAQAQPQQQSPPEEQKKKKGLFGKIVGVFK
jgi:penicillin-binding protein 1B